MKKLLILILVFNFFLSTSYSYCLFKKYGPSCPSGSPDSAQTIYSSPYRHLGFIQGTYTDLLVGFNKYDRISTCTPGGEVKPEGLYICKNNIAGGEEHDQVFEIFFVKSTGKKDQKDAKLYNNEFSHKIDINLQHLEENKGFLEEIEEKAELRSRNFNKDEHSYRKGGGIRKNKYRGNNFYRVSYYELNINSNFIIDKQYITNLKINPIPYKIKSPYS